MLDVQGEPVMRSYVFRYLGSEVHLKGGQARIVLHSRVQKYKATLVRIGQVPRKVGVNALLRLVQVVATPQLTYGFLTREPPAVLLRNLAATVRRAVWGRGEEDALLAGGFSFLLLAPPCLPRGGCDL